MAIDAVITLIKVDNLQNTNEKIELSIYSFLTQVVREESDYKRIIGKKVLPVCDERLGRLVDCALQENIEVKFFKMISVLIKNCKENIYIVKGMKEKLTRYLSDYAKELRIKNKIFHIIAVVENYEE